MEGGKKDAPYVCEQVLPYMKRLDSKKELIHCLVFNVATNVTKAAYMIQKSSSICVILHNIDIVCSFLFEKLCHGLPMHQNESCWQHPSIVLVQFVFCH